MFIDPKPNFLPLFSYDLVNVIFLLSYRLPPNAKLLSWREMYVILLAFLSSLFPYIFKDNWQMVKCCHEKNMCYYLYLLPILFGCVLNKKDQMAKCCNERSIFGVICIFCPFFLGCI